MTQDEIAFDIPGREGRRRLENVVQALASHAGSTGRDAAAGLLEAVGRALAAQRTAIALKG